MVGQLQLCLYAGGGEMVSIGQAVVRVPEIFQLDIAFVNEAGQTIIGTLWGLTPLSGCY